MAEPHKQLRVLDAPFVVPSPSGVSIRSRLKRLAPHDAEVLRQVGDHLGSLASRDLKARCAGGLEHSNDTWAARKQGLTADSSSRWAGSITKATHDQWALSRRCQLAYIHNLEAGIRVLTHRLSLRIGEKGTKRAAGGYRSKGEWFHKSRRLHVLRHRLDGARAERTAGVVNVVRGGRRLLKNRHNLSAANLTEAEWWKHWEAARWFLAADGESGKRFGNETVRPNATRAMVLGIRPFRPIVAFEGVREPVIPPRTAFIETCRRAEREHGNPVHSTPFGVHANSRTWTQRPLLDTVQEPCTTEPPPSTRRGRRERFECPGRKKP